jgi:hypothetical protein
MHGARIKIDGTILCTCLPLCCVSCRNCHVLSFKSVKEQKQLYVPPAVTLVSLQFPYMFRQVLTTNADYAPKSNTRLHLYSVLCKVRTDFLYT